MKRQILIFLRKLLCGFILLASVSCLNAQVSHPDSLRMANEELDSDITKLLKTADSAKSNILIVRKYDLTALRDTFHVAGNTCRIKKMRDTCSIDFGWYVAEDYTIASIHISKISRGYPPRENRPLPCYKDFDPIERELAGYLKSDRPPFSNFPKDKYTVVGIIGGKYIYETFDRAFLLGTEPNSLREVLGEYMGLNF